MIINFLEMPVGNITLKDVRYFPCTGTDQMEEVMCRLYCRIEGFKKGHCEPYNGSFRCVCRNNQH